MVLVDVHAHYNMEDYYKDEFSFDKLDFKDYGILILNGLDSKSNDQCLAKSGKFENLKIVTAFGWHPLEVSSTQDIKLAEKELLKIEEFEKEIVAIGEIGLDYFHVKDETIRNLQKEVFKMYLKAAEHYDLPVILHTRNAVNDILDIIEDFNKTELFNETVVLHCLEASKKNIQRAYDLGCYFTIPASVERNEHFQRLVKNIPVSRMLTETDAPFQGKTKGKQAIPSDVKLAINYIAKEKGLDSYEVENLILSNYLKVF